MKLFDLIKTNLKDNPFFSGIKTWNKFEKFAFPLIIIFIFCVSLFNGDSPLAIIAAVCGITYTILAGKGKIICYFAGMCGTLCYAYLALKNGYYGNSMLYAFYYLPMEILGILKWKKHLTKDTKEVIKTKLPADKTVKLFILTAIAALLTAFILQRNGDSHPYLDSFASIFSITGMYLTVKRCIEQWYVWFFVNLLSCIMWYFAYINGAKLLSILFMWIIYLCLAVYFWYDWRKQLSGKEINNVD